MSFLLEELLLLPFVRADQFALRNRVLAGRILDVDNLGVRRHVEAIDVEREQLEMVMMRSVALGRAGAAVSGLSEVVGHLGADPLSITDRTFGGRDIEYTPMAEGAARRI